MMPLYGTVHHHRKEGIKLSNSAEKNLFLRLFWRKRTIVVIAVCLVAAILIYLFTGGLLFQEASAAAYTEYTVGRGDVTVSLSGSGTVEPNALYEVVSMTGGDVLSDSFVEGDKVEKGDLLYTFDSSEIANTLERASLSLEKSRLSHERTLESYTELTVTSPISGNVAELYVQNGDSVNSGGKVARIVDDRNLHVRLPFSESDLGLLHVGQEAELTVENSFESLLGSVTKIYGTNRVLDGFVSVSDVEITVENPGVLSSGTYVTARAGGVGSYEGGLLEGGSEKTVTAQTSGMVEDLRVVAGENISAGAVLAVLSNDSLSQTVQDSNLSLREAELSYASTEKQYSDYTVTAPISGSVISKTVKAGDSLESSSRAVLAVIADMTVMSFTIMVDELDIAKVEKGQKAEISVDALSDRVFAGTVDNVGILGSSSNGVTTFPVRIVFDEAADLWPGMNATADIIVTSVTDVLVIPVSAVSRGNLVLVKGAAEGAGTGTDAADGAATNNAGTGAADVNNAGTDGAGSAGTGADGTGADAGAGTGSAEAGTDAADGAATNNAGTGAADVNNAGTDGAGSAGTGAGAVTDAGGAGAGTPPADVNNAGTDAGAGAGDTGATVTPPADGTGTPPAGNWNGEGRPAGEGRERGGPPSSAGGTGMPPAGDPSGEGPPTGGPPSGEFPSGTDVPPADSANTAPADTAGNTAGDPSGEGRPTGGPPSGEFPSGTGTFRPGTAAQIDQSGAPEGSHYVLVELGLNNDSFIEVLSGLQEGDIVLIAATTTELPQSNTNIGFGIPGAGMATQGGPPGGGQGGGNPGGGAQQTQRFGG
jgi:HlyD family secretion protein